MGLWPLQSLSFPVSREDLVTVTGSEGTKCLRCHPHHICHSALRHAHLSMCLTSGTLEIPPTSHSKVPGLFAKPTAGYCGERDPLWDWRCNSVVGCLSMVLGTKAPRKQQSYYCGLGLEARLLRSLTKTPVASTDTCPFPRQRLLTLDFPLGLGY